ITNFIIKLKYAPERAVFHFFQTKKARKKIKFSGKRRQGGGGRLGFKKKKGARRERPFGLAAKPVVRRLILQAEIGPDSYAKNCQTDQGKTYPYVHALASSTVIT
ncbi:MAG: hypothetical protein LBD82_05020, partial [Deltaproteobacteria bacterium]|nr:hypothetical protein [Deltaproteobacteria bacterium]